jgi:membrane protease YdiL (CAAX protease family)
MKISARRSPLIASAYGPVLRLGGYLFFAVAGLRVLGYCVPLTLLTASGVLALSAAKFLGKAADADGPAVFLPAASGSGGRLLNRFLPTIMGMIGDADAALKAHERFEAEVGGGSPAAFRNWLLSGLKAAAHWIPISLLAMLAGAVLVSPLQLVSGGLGLAHTETGHWLLRQSWPRLAGRVMAFDVLGQVYLMSGIAVFEALFRRLGFKRSDPALASAAVLSSIFLSYLLINGFAWMQALPMLGIQMALFYAYARTRTLLVPGAANVAIGLASLYSARMVVLLTADLGSIEALPGIPGSWGVLAALGVSFGLFAALAAARFGAAEGRNFLKAAAREQWDRLRSAGASWSRTVAVPRSPLALAPVGMLWGIGVYLVSYLSYSAAYCLFPVEETVPAVLKQTLLMPLDMLVYLFLTGAALEELIFRKGLFKALFDRIESKDAGLRFWLAAAVSAVVFSGFHFIDFGVALRFLGINVSRLIQSLMMVYGFSWAGFTGRVAAGLLLALLYDRAGILLIPIIAHFTSNLLEAVGLRWGLPWFLAAAACIFALQLLDDRGGKIPAAPLSRR